MGICDGRVVIITGAGRGIGRAHAIEFASQGAKVVVNDLGAEMDGSVGADNPAHQVVEEIKGMGGEAVVNGDDISDWEGAQRLVNTAIETFGKLDTLVNNAGILRDRMMVNMTIDDWDAVMKVHLRGTFCPTRWAAAYWREETKAGRTVDARVVNTSSGAGLYGNVGQTNYASAKAGIAAFTLVAAAELGRYGVTVNAIAPAARTRMTEQLFASNMAKPEQGFDAMAPENIAPVVVWLGSNESAGVTGQVFSVSGGRISVNEGWVNGPTAEQDDRWDPTALTPVMEKLVAERRPPVPVIGSAQSDTRPG